MGKIARIISSKIEDDKIICTCELYVNYNVQAELYLPPNDDSFPLPDDRTLLIEVEGSGKYIACGIWSSNSKTLEKGEKLLFSRDNNGNLKSKIYLKKDGKIILNEGTDFAVRYNELKTQLDQLKSDLNNFITLIYNTHTHAIPTGNSGVPSPTGTSSTVNFANCKVSKINLPSVAED